MIRRNQGARSSRAGSISKQDRKRMAWLDRECTLAKARAEICWDRSWILEFYSHWNERFKKLDAKRLTLRLKMKQKPKEKARQENS